MEEKKLTIFSVYHKEFAVPDCDFIKPIQVGKYFSKLDLGFLSDDQGDHIAEKNLTFSELTALYWIWKNLDHIPSEWIGICHYRRYFTLPEISVKKKMFITKVKTDESDVYHKSLSEEHLEKVCSPEIYNLFISHLEGNKVIVPKAAPLMIELKYPSSIKMHYVYYHIREDWYLMQDIVLRLYPDFEQSFHQLFENQEKMFCYNMFIGNKKFVGEYSSWLFSILFELEKVVKLSEYPYQRRIFGFFSERLLNLYLYHYQKETVEFPVLHFV